jgi:hypothetical protein
MVCYKKIPVSRLCPQSSIPNRTFQKLEWFCPQVRGGEVQYSLSWAQKQLISH